MATGSAREATVPIEAIIFDMDGLLVDSEGVAADALRRFLAGHGREMRAETLEGALGRRLPEAMAVIAMAYDLPEPVEALVATFDGLRLEALRGNVVPMPGAGALLRWARQAGFRLALATSSFRSHADVALAETGLIDQFDAMVTGDEVEHGKPAPDLFLLAAHRLNSAPASCLVLEDAPAGLEAAARAGMRRLWIPNSQTASLAPGVSFEARLDSLFEVIPWVEHEGREESDPG